jgi:hypothetical protein
MKPNLGLMYSGSRVNGPVGLGWTVQGISMITRCAGSKQLDGYFRRVDYSGDDKLCLDGQRLIQTSGTGAVLNEGVSNPGVTNPFQQSDSLGGTGLVREYRTEKDMYARIRAYGAAGGNPANGPAYFKVWTKSGQIYEYGVNANTTSNALITASGKQVAVAWPVSRISDTVGNYIDFQYEQIDRTWGSGAAVGTPYAGREWNLTEVRYTGNAAQLPVNRIVFSYEDRSDTPGAAQDRAEAYFRGSKTVSIRRLNAVRTYINWPANLAARPATAVPVRTIKLVYDNGPVTRRSRVIKLQECAGADENKCMPATSFGYAADGGAKYVANSNFAASSIATLGLQSTTGEFGVTPGDFDGDGKMDFIRWSNTASENALYLSNGDGTFRVTTAFNIKSENLFKNDGCYSSFLFDMNGDGLPDILRYSSPKNDDGYACPSYGPILVFLNNGNGSFSQLTYNGPTLQRKISASTGNCAVQYTNGGCAEPGDHYGWSEGDNFFLLDANGDGKLDILTTVLPNYPATAPAGDACVGQICTRLFLGNGNGTFTETQTNLAHTSVYVAPKPINYKLAASANPSGSLANVVDVDSDGLTDLIGVETIYFNKTPTFRSQGNGNFEALPTYQGCVDQLIDFNGDGFKDCLLAGSSTAYPSSLRLTDGTSTLFTVANFNLTAAGQELGGDGVGYRVADIDRDGRDDILRWKDDASQNQIFLSNGDGSFRAASDTGLVGIQLQKADSNAGFILGDFTGRGFVEILRLVANPSAAGDATRNQLYVKADTLPPDQLVSVTSGSGLTTSLTWVSLANSSSGTLGARYASDRGTANAAAYPAVDMTIPQYVVATSTADTATGARLATEFSYAGLKSAHDGRGWLGFRETRTQQVAPNGDYLTVITRNLQTEPFIGMAASTETRGGMLNAASAPLISRTTNIYCDTRATAGADASATSAAPCASTAKLQRPYLYKSTEEGWDLNGAALPTVTTTNAFNSDGDPTRIEVTTTGTALNGLAQTFTKVTTNLYQDDIISDDLWILGRLKQATVQSTVPNDIGRIPTSAGTAPSASATHGSSAALALSCSGGGATTTPTPATLSCVLTNTGDAGAASISYSTIPGVSIAGPTGACAAGATCGTVTLTTGTAGGTYAGTLTATPNAGSAAAVQVSLTVNGQAALSMSCSGGGATTTPTPATLSCALANSGQTAIASVSYSSIPGATVSGPTGACAAGASCGTVTVTTGTAAGTYTGTLTATPNTGSPASAAVNLQVRTAPTLSLSCSGGAATTTPTPASMSCTITNTGQTAAASLSYSSIVGTTISGPTGACAAGASCGTVTVTSGSAAGTYSGTLTVTPNTGSAASTSVSLIVRSLPSLSLSCPASASSTEPNAAVISCSLNNTGSTSASSIAYGGFAGVSVSGPASCAANSSCGSVSVTSAGTPGTYSGTLTATPNSGSGASAALTLSVKTLPRLRISSCTTVSPTATPNTASMRCLLSNDGDTSVTSLSYSSGAGTTVSGPAVCYNNGNCAYITVTSGSGIGTYSGTVTATPNIGQPVSFGYSLSVDPATTTITSSPASLDYGSLASGGMRTMSVTVSNAGSQTANGMSYAVKRTSGLVGNYSIASQTCGASLAPGGSCTVSITYTATCNAGAVYGQFTASGTNFNTATTSLSAGTLRGVCQN